MPTRLTPRFDAAVALARDLHDGQLRKGTEIPYLSHLLAVASIVLEAGGSQTSARTDAAIFFYRDNFKMSQQFVQVVNKYGGKAELLMLADAGLKGNTHIPFADMNNVAVADLLSKFLAQHGLDKR